MGDNIKIDPKKIVWEGLNWINLAQSREEVAGCCECGNERFDSIKWGDILNRCGTGIFPSSEVSK
jgi:hypothetical protein